MQIIEAFFVLKISLLREIARFFWGWYFLAKNRIFWQEIGFSGKKYHRHLKHWFSVERLFCCQRNFFL